MTIQESEGMKITLPHQFQRIIPKTLVRIILMMVAAALIASGNLCIVASKVNGSVPYQSLTVTLLIEVGKLIICSSVLLYQVCVVRSNKETSHSIFALSLKESMLYSIPAFLYMLDNNIVFIIMKYMDPATLSVVWNLKIVVTAIMYRFILKRSVSKLQWISITLLMLGIVTSQANHHTQQKEQADDTATSGLSSGFGFACGLVVVGVTISSTAGVYTEWALKRKPHRSFFVQNAHFYIYGVIFNTLGYVLMDDSTSFFTGYNAWTISTIVIQIAGGMTMGVLFKYLDNIAVVFSHAIAMILTALVSMIVFRFQPHLEFVCGVGVTIISLYLYHVKPEDLAGHTKIYSPVNQDG